MSITTQARVVALAVLLSSAPLLAQQAAAPKHHSKLKGAVAGAVIGHAAGGHAKAGAVAGALVQHHRNKKGS
jgi:hypothetical protein